MNWGDRVFLSAKRNGEETLNRLGRDEGKANTGSF